MIYSRDDVKKILDEVLERCSIPLEEGGSEFFYKNDRLPPKVLLKSRVFEIVYDIKGKL